MTVTAQNIVLAELRAAAVREVEVVQGGKHRQVRWKVNGSSRFITVPGTPSDWRSAANLKADVRRMLRANGLLVDPVPTEKPRPKPKDQLSRLEQAMRALEQRLAKLEANGAQADSCATKRGGTN